MTHGNVHRISTASLILLWGFSRVKGVQDDKLVAQDVQTVVAMTVAVRVSHATVVTVLCATTELGVAVFFRLAVLQEVIIPMRRTTRIQTDASGKTTTTASCHARSLSYAKQKSFCATWATLMSTIPEVHPHESLSRLAYSVDAQGVPRRP